jgi:non-specific serine/threonine protein kinase
MGQRGSSCSQEPAVADQSPSDRVVAHPMPLVPLRGRARDAARLPAPLTSFVGREREVAAVAGLLHRDDVRLVVLTGPGGGGKTRLALRVAEQVADEFPDGVAFVPFAAVRDPNLVAATLALALSVRELPDRSLTDGLKAVLSDRVALLVLDNLEHLTPAATLLPDLLAACGRLKILATSRTVLRVSGEHAFQVPPLALPEVRRESGAERRENDGPTTHASLLPSLTSSEAVRLFGDRARAVRSGFEVSAENVSDVAAICIKLDGLPLAIELAAARVTVFPPASLLSRLDKRLPLLTGGAHDAPARLQTMRSAIAWSHDLLGPDDQWLFRRLAVFSGGFTLSAAEAVAAVPVLDGVTALVDQSLLRRTEDEGDEPRFWMLETIREFGLERLAEAGEDAAVRDRHASFFLAMAERAESEMTGPRTAWWLDSLEADLGNLRSALAWLDETGQIEGLSRLAGALGYFWHLHRHADEGRRWLERALAVPDGVAPTVRSRCLTALLRSLPEDGSDRQLSLAEECLALRNALGDEVGITEAIFFVGHAYLGRGEEQRAIECWEDALARASTQNDLFVSALLHTNLGDLCFDRGDDQRAEVLAEEALALSRRLGNNYLTALALASVAQLAARRSDTGRAWRLFAECVPMYQAFGDPLSIVDALTGMAYSLVRDQPIPAIRWLAMAERVRESVGAAELMHPYWSKQAIGAARAICTAEEFSAAWSAGLTLPLEDAVTEALGMDAPSRAQSAPIKVAAAHRLTSRELEVLRLLATGMSDKEIAAELSISYRTVTNHVGSVLAKLGVESRVAAATYAVRHGLADSPDDGV